MDLEKWNKHIFDAVYILIQSEKTNNQRKNPSGIPVLSNTINSKTN